MSRAASEQGPSPEAASWRPLLLSLSVLTGPPLSRFCDSLLAACPAHYCQINLLIKSSHSSPQDLESQPFLQDKAHTPLPTPWNLSQPIWNLHLQSHSSLLTQTHDPLPLGWSLQNDPRSLCLFTSPGFCFLALEILSLFLLHHLKPWLFLLLCKIHIHKTNCSKVYSSMIFRTSLKSPLSSSETA